jgi:ribosomal protein L27
LYALVEGKVSFAFKGPLNRQTVFVTQSQPQAVVTAA